MGGDFNIVRQTSERLGGRPIDFTSTSEFNDCINECGLLEIECIGSSIME